MARQEAWSNGERRVFTAAAEALIGEPVSDDIAAAAERFVSHLAPADRRQLALLLRLLEYAPVVTGRFQRFTNLSRARRARVLRGWEASRLTLRRQGAAALKAITMLAHYGHDAAWPAVGYDGPWLGRVAVPVLPAPALLRARSHNEPGIVSAREARSDVHVRAQACVIGTGAGGAAALARLAALGVDVVAIEAGPHFTAADYTQREHDMLPLLFEEAALRATTNKAIGILQGRGVGGSTLHNTGLVYTLPRGIAQRWRDEHGFPLEAERLDHYLAQASDTLHAVPIPEQRINASNALLRRGAEARGWRYRVPLHNRVECCGCGYCILGCAYNRKHNAALTYVPRALAAGARVLTDVRAVAIRGTRGSRVVVGDVTDGSGRRTGARAVVEAAVVVCAAGALDTPALLLRSSLGNKRVGRGLRLHPAPLVAGVFAEPVQAWRGLPQSVVVEEFATFLESGRGGFLFIASSAWPGITAAVVPGSGAAHRAIMRAYPHLSAAAVLLHDETEGRVTAGRDGRPLAHYWPDRNDQAELRRGVRELARLYLAAGAERVHLPYADAPPVRTEAELDAALARARAVPHRVSLNSVHPQGSCPLGARRDRSAADPHGRLWGEPDIYIADTSLFPTSVGVPPQVTTMALATAVADYLVEEAL